jgi:hypothetical protein
VAFVVEHADERLHLHVAQHDAVGHQSAAPPGLPRVISM